MASLAQAYLHRQTRLFEINQAVPALFWVLLIGFAAALIGILLCFGIENVGAQVAFTAIFAVAIGFVLLLVRLLDLPFQGALHLTPADFESTLDSVLSLAGSASH